MGEGENNAVVRTLLFGAQKRHGVLTRQDALKEGLRASAIDRLLRARKWKVLFDGVYCAFGATESRALKIEAARRWAGDDAVVSHFTAAELWGLAGLERPVAIHLSSTGVNKPPPHNAIVLHRVKRLDARDQMTHRGHRVTTPLRTLADLAPLVTDKELELAMMDARRRKLLSVETLQKWVDERHRRRIPNLDRLVRVIQREALLIPTESPLEDQIVQVLVDAELRPPAGQLTLSDATGRIGRADLGFPDARLLIEVDGAIHDSALKMIDDRHRDERARRVGYAVIRARHRHLSGPERAQFLDAVRSALRSATTRTARSDWPYSKLTYVEYLPNGARQRRTVETGRPPSVPPPSPPKVDQAALF